MNLKQYRWMYNLKKQVSFPFFSGLGTMLDGCANRGFTCSYLIPSNRVKPKNNWASTRRHTWLVSRQLQSLLPSLLAENNVIVWSNWANWAGLSCDVLLHILSEIAYPLLEHPWLELKSDAEYWCTDQHAMLIAPSPSHYSSLPAR